MGLLKLQHLPFKNRLETSLLLPSLMTNEKSTKMRESSCRNSKAGALFESILSHFKRQEDFFIPAKSRGIFSYPTDLQVVGSTFTELNIKYNHLSPRKSNLLMLWGLF